MAIELCTDTDVIQRFGGMLYANQVSDADGDGSYDATRLQLARVDASEAVAAACAVQIDVTAAIAASNVPQFMVTLAAQKALYLYWLYGTQGQAIPEAVKQLNSDVDVECERIRRRERTIGAPTSYPGTSQCFVQVDADPDRNRNFLSSFRRSGGFR